VTSSAAEVIYREAQFSVAGGILSRAVEIYRFAAEMNQAAEFRFFSGNCQISGYTVLAILVIAGC